MRFAIEYWGVSFAVECYVPELESQVAKLILPMWETQPSLSPTSVFKLIRTDEGSLKVDGPDVEVAIVRDDPVEILERRIHYYIATQSTQAVFVHAGVVSWQGFAILLPGRSFAGKSTLTLALCQAGAAYMSDEYAVVDAQGCIHPFPRPMSQRHPDGALRIEAEQLGWRRDMGPVRSRGIVSLRFDPEMGFSLEAMTRGEAVMELFNNSISAQRAPELNLSCLSQAVVGAQCWKGTRGEAPEAAERILKLLS